MLDSPKNYNHFSCNFTDTCFECGYFDKTKKKYFKCVRRANVCAAALTEEQKIYIKNLYKKE